MRREAEVSVLVSGRELLPETVGRETLYAERKAFEESSRPILKVLLVQLKRPAPQERPMQALQKERSALSDETVKVQRLGAAKMAPTEQRL